MDTNYTVTVNADKRYYLDENLLVNAGSLISSISVFNNAAMDLYNICYDKAFNGSEDDSFKCSSYLADKYKLNAYYACSVFTAASAVVSSQKKLIAYHIKLKLADIKARKDKAAKLTDKLQKAELIKCSLRTYLMTGEWIKPYPKYSCSPNGANIRIIKKDYSVEQYERMVDRRIKRLKNNISHVQYGLRRREQELKYLKPERIVFGSKKLYSEKDKDGTDMKSWKESFCFSRHRSMSLPGRHTSKDGNFLVRYDSWKHCLIVKCIDGKEMAFREFSPARFKDEYTKLITLPKGRHQSICYNFTLHKDRDGREYIIPSITMTLKREYENLDYSTGCVAADINYDRIAVADIDEKGRLQKTFTYKFNPDGVSSGAVTNSIGRIIDKVFAYCNKVYKPLVCEDIDIVLKKGLKYGSQKKNRHLSMFAYKKIQGSIRAASYRYSIGFTAVDPKYTSLAGKVLYMREYGIPVHESAAYTIGLKGLEKFPEVPDYLSRFGKSHTMQWSSVYKKFSSLKYHVFYSDIKAAAGKAKSFTSLARQLKELAAA